MELKIDPEKVTVADVMDLESGSIRAVHDFVVRFAVDDKGTPMDPDESSAVLRAMTLPELTAWAETISTQINEAAIPPQIARSSKRGSKSAAKRRSG